MTIPIVMLNDGDPVGLGLVASLARPGRQRHRALRTASGWKPSAKRLELLRDAVPNLRSVAILSNPANPAHALAIKSVEVAGRRLWGWSFNRWRPELPTSSKRLRGDDDSERAPS